MFIATRDTQILKAPEGRHVYRKPIPPIPTPAEHNMLSEMGGYGITGDWMRRGWVSQPVGLGNQPTIARSNETSCTNGKGTLVYLAPEGRHVYSNTGYTNP